MFWKIREKVCRKEEERDFVQLHSNHKKKNQILVLMNSYRREEFNKSDFTF